MDRRRAWYCTHTSTHLSANIKQHRHFHRSEPIAGLQYASQQFGLGPIPSVSNGPMRTESTAPKELTKVLVTSLPRLFYTLTLPLLLMTLNRVDVSTPRRLDQGLARQFSTWHTDKSPQASFLGPLGGGFFLFYTCIFFAFPLIPWVSKQWKPGNEWRVTSDESHKSLFRGRSRKCGPRVLVSVVSRVQW